MGKIVKLVRSDNRISRDPLDVNLRLYNQVAILLDQLEKPDSNTRITLRERIQALVAIGRIQTIFVGLRKEKISDESAGSAVRKYNAAFKNGGSGRKKNTGLAKLESKSNTPDDWFEQPGIADDDDDDTD